MSVRKQVLFKVGGFNPDGFGDRRLIWYRGDGEIGLQKRIQSAGYQVLYTSAAVMEHRTPPERMTSIYLRMRAFDNGIEGNYKYYRYQQPSLGKFVLRCGLLFTKLVYHSLRNTVAHLGAQKIDSLKISLQHEYYRGQLLHSFRLLFQPDLHRQCRRDNYLD
jgi:hypothetical protein